MFDEEERELAKSRANRANVINKFIRYSEARLAAGAQRILKTRILKHFYFFKIKGFIEETVANNPSIASSYIAGKSIENRDLIGLVLKTATSTKPVWSGNITHQV